MHIEEPATQQFEVDASQRCAPVSSEPGLLTAPLMLDDKQQLQSALRIALGKNGLGLWEWNPVTGNFHYDSLSLRILGYENAEIPNYKAFELLIHPQDLLNLTSVRKAFLENMEVTYEVEFRITTKSGDWKWIVERGVVAYLDDGGSVAKVIGTHQDVTTTKCLNLELQNNQQKEDFLNNIRGIIDRHHSLETILQIIVREIGRFFHTDRVAIYQIFPEMGIIAADSHGQLPDSQDVSKMINGNNYCGKAGFITPILRHYLGENSSPHESQSAIWGMLVLNHRSNNHQSLLPWETWEIEILKQVSREIAIAIQKSQLQTTQKQAIQALAQIENAQQQLAQFQSQLLQKAKLSTLGELIVDLVNEIYKPVNFIFSTINYINQYAVDIIHLLEEYQQYYPIPALAIVYPTSVISPESCTSQKKPLSNIELTKTEFLNSLWSIGAAAEQLQDKVSALYKFSQCDNSQVQKTDLHDGLNNLLAILQPRFQEKSHRLGIQVIKQFGNIPLVECFPGELNQAFMNILTNAIEALEERMKHDYSFTPKIWISTEIVNNHLSLISNDGIKTREREVIQRQKVIVRISDNGKGILPHIQRHIFEPFFTTKVVTKTNGLGLTISHNIIVEKHHGKLSCKSQLGKGSEFLIEISTENKRYSHLQKPVIF
ncbi:PAS/PAC sensor signal transduction histidine kinase [Calothrix sp. NIES-4101]|nr:PAS/PAC sensor signal transduction histidine kinase [Calothrix sp. NIES-4101]